MTEALRRCALGHRPNERLRYLIPLAAWYVLGRGYSLLAFAREMGWTRVALGQKNAGRLVVMALKALAS